MKIPNSENAAVDIDKLAQYVLSPDHERGKHKARVFISALGMVQTDAEALRSTLLSVVRNEDAVLGEKDEYGQRYVLDFLLTWYEK